MKKQKKCIVIYTEGETEEEFYNLILDKTKEKYKIRKFNADLITKKCIKGICKFENKLLSKFKKEIISEYKEYRIIVYLCYDTDVFVDSVNPPIDRNKIEVSLKKMGASEVFHIKADKCIEDVFLYDIEGICKFLKIKKVKSVSGKNGVEKMKKLFERANRVYQKGYSCEGLVKKLNIDLIEEKIEKQLLPLLNEILPDGVKVKK